MRVSDYPLSHELLIGSLVIYTDFAPDAAKPTLDHLYIITGVEYGSDGEWISLASPWDRRMYYTYMPSCLVIINLP